MKPSATLEAYTPETRSNDLVQRRVEIAEPATSVPDETAALETRESPANSMRIEGFVFLPDGSPGVGEHVEVLLNTYDTLEMVRKTFVADENGDFAGSLTIPSTIPIWTRVTLRSSVHSSRGFASQSQAGVEIANHIDSPAILPLRMKAGGVLTGRVVTRSGEPIASCAIYLCSRRDYDDPQHRLTNPFRTAPDGRFALLLENKDPVILLAQVSDYGARCVQIEASNLAELALGDVVVDKGEAELVGLAVAEHGALLVDLPWSAVLAGSGNTVLYGYPRAALEDCDSGLARGSTSTDASGRLHMQGLIRGSYSLEARGPLQLKAPGPPSTPQSIKSSCSEDIRSRSRSSAKTVSVSRV